MFPFLEEKFNTKMLFLGIIGAALFGLWSVSKDVLELFRIISKVKLVATKKISEKITTKATGEIAEIADAFNIVISELEDEVVAQTIKDGLGTNFEKKAGEAFLQMVAQKEFDFIKLYET